MMRSFFAVVDTFIKLLPPLYTEKQATTETTTAKSPIIQCFKTIPPSINIYQRREKNIIKLPTDKRFSDRHFQGK